MESEKAKMFDEFKERMRQRLEDGEIKYGDKFLRVDMFDEIGEEMLDIANYAFLLYFKIKRLQVENKG